MAGVKRVWISTQFNDSKIFCFRFIRELEIVSSVPKGAKKTKINDIQHLLQNILDVSRRKRLFRTTKKSPLNKRDNSSNTIAFVRLFILLRRHPKTSWSFNLGQTDKIWQINNFRVCCGLCKTNIDLQNILNFYAYLIKTKLKRLLFH